MTPQEVIVKITPIFQSVFNDSDLEVVLDLTSDDIDEWSSITQAMLMTEIERVFNIKFKLRDLATANNVQAIVTLILNKLT